MPDTNPTILWLRRDLRLSDNPALIAACEAGGPVLPVFIHDDGVAALGAAPKWRLGLSLEALARDLEARGSRLILRRGPAREVIASLIEETGAKSVHWSRLYDAQAIARDSEIKSMLKARGIDAVSHNGHLLFEPWTVQTGTGGYYKVYTPMWRAVKDREVAEPQAAPSRLPAPETWPASDRLDDWHMGAGMARGAAVVAAHQTVGEDAAQDRLAAFIAQRIADYDTARDRPGENGTSNLSENLTYGEISARQCWHAGLRALHEGAADAEAWIKELVWREFAYHLMYHTPQLLERNWRPEWDAFPWLEDEDEGVLRWKQGRTGILFVDAAMREMYVTGRMHNRARMNVASYLTKHMMHHWRIGMDWFADCLTDWDPASNAMGWQWAAGCGPDAAPYFRVFNPETQLKKFDPQGAYARRWIAEGQANPGADALSFYEAIPESWGLSPRDPYPAPLVGLAEGRKRALAAYEAREF